MSPETVRVVRRLCAVALLVVVAGPAAAQTPDPPTLPSVIPVAVAPLPWLVVDVRGGLPSLGQDLITAGDLGVAAADLPSRAKALVVGAHAYPIRRESFKVGFGAEVLLGSASSQKKDAQGEPAGPVVHRRVDSLSAQVSLNFGRGAGWSYLTVGSGPFKFESSLDEAVPDGQGSSTINFGGGARWFNWAHIAFTMDLRFYLTKPGNPTLVTAGRERKKVVLLSAGISIK
ncbi:MAG: hypothetical protein HQ485_03290 [Acidobacteria bacterium]|nr:hypothetical protein [Acidobacteriota bacterium]